MLNPMIMKGVKLVAEVAAVAGPIAVNYFKEQELKKKIEKIAAEAVAKAMQKES